MQEMGKGSEAVGVNNVARGKKPAWLQQPVLAITPATLAPFCCWGRLMLCICHAHMPPLFPFPLACITALLLRLASQRCFLLSLLRCVKLRLL